MQLKDFASITASMIAWARASQDRVTDFEVGSVMRTLLEAPAAEIDELYQQMFAGIREAIPVSVYRTFGFPLLDAQPAAGVVRVTISAISADTLIPAGTVFARAGAGQGDAQYISGVDVILPALATIADVPVRADRAGTASNTVPGVAFAMNPEPLGFVSAISSGGMAGGTNGETDDARQARFREFVSSLQRGTVRALAYGATLATIQDAAGAVTERVTSASVVEPYLVDPLLYTPGLVWLYIETRTALPSAGIIEQAQRIIDGYQDGATVVPGWKSAGVQVEVRAATRTAVDVTGVLSAQPGYDATALRTQAAALIGGYLLDLPINAPALRADIIAAVMGIEGVRNITLTAPAADVAAAVTVKLAPGTITLT